MQIKRVNIDPILTVAKLEMPEMRDAAYTPEPIDISTPDIPEDIGNITHGIEALNATREVKENKPGWTDVTPLPDFNSVSARITNIQDTAGMYEAMQKALDSAKRRRE